MDYFEIVDRGFIKLNSTAVVNVVATGTAATATSVARDSLD